MRGSVVYTYILHYISLALCADAAECYARRMTSSINSTEFINRAVLEGQQRAKRLLPKPTEQTAWIFPHLNSHYDSLSVYLGSSELLGLADVVVMQCDASGVVTDARGWNRLEHMAARVLALHTCTTTDGDELASDFLQFLQTKEFNSVRKKNRT